MVTPDPPRLMPVCFQPLVWPAGEKLLAEILVQQPSAENLLAFLRGPAAPTVALPELHARYADVSQHDRLLLALPDHPLVRNNILVPLHSAKAAFVLGHYVSCIALGGMVAEMLAVFRFEITQPSAKLRSRLSDREFGRLGQEKRIDLLAQLELIDTPTARVFTGVRGRRRRYMHLLRKHDRQAAGDAKEVYKGAVELTRRVMGVGLSGTSITFHEDVIRLLRDAGLLEEG